MFRFVCLGLPFNISASDETVKLQKRAACKYLLTSGDHLTLFRSRGLLKICRYLDKSNKLVSICEPCVMLATAAFSPIMLITVSLTEQTASCITEEEGKIFQFNIYLTCIEMGSVTAE